MTSTEQNTHLGMRVIAAWLDERGFKEAATRLLEASDEVAQLVDDVKYSDWLYRQRELKEAARTSGNENDLPWE